MTKTDLRVRAVRGAARRGPAARTRAPGRLGPAWRTREPRRRRSLRAPGAAWLLLAAALGAIWPAGCGGLEPEGADGREATSTDRPRDASEPAALAAAGAGAASETRPETPARPPGAPPPLPAPSAIGHDLGPARLDFLGRSLAQLRRLERAIGEMGPNRDGAAALAAAALASHGRAEPAEAAGKVREALDACAGRWHEVDCERGLLSLQRVAIQYPAVLPPPLAERLRREAAAAAPPPDPARIASPWTFRETENQRAVLVARSLAGHTLAGTGDTPAARAWADYAAAFLRAHDADGWYEADSPGYLGISVQALLHLHDLAPDPKVRRLAGRQLHLVFARWAARQVGGVPAGARTRTYAHWALGTKNTPWRAWAHYAAGVGDPADVAFGDWPEIAVSAYEFPEPLRELLRHRRAQGSYEVRERRRIDPDGRSPVDGAVYSFVTPDYVLSAAQAVEGLALSVSGGQEILATLFPEGPAFAPLYLWSRADTARRNRWASRTGREQAVASRNLLLARMGTTAEPGYAYLSPPWGRPEPAGGGEGGAEPADTPVLVARYGDTWVAMVTEGGWEVAPARERFAALFGRDKTYAVAWAAVPRRQPAAIALEVARASEAGSFEAWRERAARLRLAVERADGEPTLLSFRSTDGRRFTFRPGRAAAVDGEPIRAAAYPLLDSPFLAREQAAGRPATWRFRFGDFDYTFEPLDAAVPPPRRP